MMKRYLYSLLLALFPILGLAADSLSFAPPPSDVSVVFLGNVFGTVDGVLHGTGSQIMGAMFGVFNAAVLALGGIVIIYTLLVATMNTAHEGQMLGQKWSSIWVPVRSTLGLALLIPKASGYCLMQIFIMWVVVQGVGAADKVWDAALSYLNRGGVIIQQQINPLRSITGGGSQIYTGAATILSAQVCMLGIEKVLTKARDGFLKEKQNGGGICFNPTSSNIKEFCDTPVPDFLNTVNVLTIQSSKTAGASEVNSVALPRFTDGSVYANLNGICGSITWNDITTGQMALVKNSFSKTGTISNELDTVKLSRAIAVQQMYSDLSTIAQVIVNNSPELSKPAAAPTPQAANPTALLEAATKKKNEISTNTPAAPWAQMQFGVPNTASGQICGSNDGSCVSWGSDQNMTQASLFSGVELQGVVADYNNVMLPTLNLINRAVNNNTADAQRSFLKEASLRGWMMAGSYFFNLATINTGQSSVGKGGFLNMFDATPIDSNSGLQDSKFVMNNIKSGFNGANCSRTSLYAVLCEWLGRDSTKLDPVLNLLNAGVVAEIPAIPLSNTSVVATGPKSSTTYGFITNSLFLSLPQQQGMKAPTFVFRLIPSFKNNSQFSFPDQQFTCGEVEVIWPFSFCLIQWLGQLFYDFFIKFLFNFVLQIVTTVINMALMAFLSLPLQGMSEIFQEGVSFIKQPNVNPIVALAYMGVNYINFSMNLWIYLIILAIQCALFPIVGIFIFALIALAAPLVLAWLSIMVGIGFTTAYFIPFTPYMIFTFASIAWLMAVIEAMVAAPIVALGITHPEGKGPFGKGEQAVMVLMNVFLRPALMIVGYIAGIILSYVSVWIINAGFANVMVFIQGNDTAQNLQWWPTSAVTPKNQPAQTHLGFSDWAGAYGFFFCILIYTTTYLAVVQKAFTLITSLPDKVLRWIGGQPETIGQEAAQWGEDVKRQVEAGGQATQKAGGQMSKQLGGYATKAISKVGSAGDVKLQ